MAISSRHRDESAPAAPRHARDFLNRSCGFTLVELLIALGIFSVLAALAAPYFDNRREEINTAMATFIADVRFARDRAMNSGTHFALRWIGSSRYDVQELRETGKSWSPAKTARRSELPPQINVSMSPAAVEFNTRGWMVSKDGPVDVDFADSFGATHRVSIWPSGQVFYEW